MPEWRPQEVTESRERTISSNSRIGVSQAGKLTIAALAVLAALIAFAPLAEAKVKRSFYGVVPDVSSRALSTKDYDTMKRGKVGAVRFLLSWPNVQKGLDAGFNWSVIDELVDSMARRNIEPRPFFYGSLHRNESKPPLGSKKMKKGWQEFVSAAVQRYGRNGSFWEQPGRPYKPVKVWQILNEQNSSKFYKPKPKPKQYARVVKMSSRAIRSADKKADVILGGMFATPQSPKSPPAWKFLNKFYKSKGIKKKFDGVAAHPYSPDIGGVKFQLRKLRGAMKKNGDKRTKLYVTEIGWGSDSIKGNPLTKGRKGQARLLGQSFKLFERKRRKWNIAGAFWYHWRDSPLVDPCSWCPSAGLLEGDYGRKPSWHKFVDMTGGQP